MSPVYDDIEADIREIAASIWETLFSAPLERGSAPEPLGEAAAAGVTGCVHIDGAWHGAVTVQCGDELAQRLAGELYRSDEATADDVRDTVGELTNMLAGNIKALLPEPSRISLPTVANGADYALTVIGTQPVATVAFTCAGLPLVVTLLERQEAVSS